MGSQIVYLGIAQGHNRRQFMSYDGCEGKALETNNKKVTLLQNPTRSTVWETNNRSALLLVAQQPPKSGGSLNRLCQIIKQIEYQMTKKLAWQICDREAELVWKEHIYSCCATHTEYRSATLAH